MGIPLEFICFSLTISRPSPSYLHSILLGFSAYQITEGIIPLPDNERGNKSPCPPQERDQGKWSWGVMCASRSWFEGNDRDMSCSDVDDGIRGAYEGFNEMRWRLLMHGELDHCSSGSSGWSKRKFAASSSFLSHAK